MKKIILATNNLHKVQEIKEILHNIDWELVPLPQLIKDFHVFEDGQSYAENAIKKAESVARYFNQIALGEDSGLEVDVLNGAPGIFSARFAGEPVSYDNNIKKLLNLLEGVPEEKRTARFRCVCAIAFPYELKKPTVIFEGVCEGKIAFSLRGNRGFGYDPIFIPQGYNKTFAEMTSEEKNRISHRALALKKVETFLCELKDI
ncbi:MAG: XTP/dITP diphosphatase [candidate division WOR-3 bacterium]|nr:XTP/dITP diphosphatase [candidate division WOR-3 bacterium]MCX7756790.1 XTP/dITP diphosphatase [candidate division WOR-3 bacterium]MDW7987561.1 XTP/dITP diphosphatase [candidate division WOR-3 bacterium]